MGNRECHHRDEIADVTPPDITVCEDCVKTGDSWVALRMCMTCGHVGCCNSSKNKHATKHFTDSDHPIMKSVTEGEEFMWCYVDELYLR